MRHLLLLSALACSNEPGLEPGFEDQIAQGWVCQGWGAAGRSPTGDDVPSVFYVGLDDREHFRVQVSLGEGDGTFTEDTDLTEASFRVYVGSSLIVDNGSDPCDDVISGGQQDIDSFYLATAGTASVVEEAGNRIGLEVRDIVLEPRFVRKGKAGWAELPDVEVREAFLAAMPVNPN